MQKLRFFLILSVLPSLLFAQQRTKIILQNSSALTVDTKTNISYVRNPVFRQDNATLTCDSAVFYQERNYFEAFKNVHINQGDTMNIYSDFLNYDGNQKLAHLNTNVRMVDRTSTLTTNILDYNMASKIGTYIEGGKIVNREVTVTSKNGWYFANSRDAYFRYNVLVTTPQSTIKSDTLRYNTLSNWTYFYGPTNIKGKDDNLYTENGAYNTRSENAYFGKKNLYTQGTKSLKGDSLYYNGKTGYGKAVKNIVFIDTSDRTLLRGQLGEYYKIDERVVVTKNAYFGMGTKDSVMVKDKKIPDTLWLGADTLEAQKVLQKTLKLLNKPIIQKDNEVGADEEKAKEEKAKEKAAAKKAAADAEIETAKTVTANRRTSKKDKKALEKQSDSLKSNLKIPDSIKIDKEKLKPDSLIKDSLLIAKTNNIKKDSVTNDIKNQIVKKDNVKTVTAVAKQAKTILTNAANAKDSLNFNPADTVRARVIKAYHNVRVYKSNMQAKADSLFYTAADSTLRWYKNPILWSQGSQQTGDTINVFFKNNKIHSFQVLQSGFIVNVETDSTKFNQVKGKKITGFFTDGELSNMYVDGNAESIYYTKNDKNEYDNMNQTVSSRIRFKFATKELTDIVTIRENEGAAYPIDKLPKEALLTGFIWKPELRPISKADIIKGRPAVKTANKVVNPAKTPSKSKNTNTTTKPTSTPQVSTKNTDLKEGRSSIPAQPKLTDSVKIDTAKKKVVVN